MTGTRREPETSRDAIARLLLEGPRRGMSANDLADEIRARFASVAVALESARRIATTALEKATPKANDDKTNVLAFALALANIAALSPETDGGK